MLDKRFSVVMLLRQPTQLSSYRPPSGKSIQVKVYHSETYWLVENWTELHVNALLHWPQKWNEGIQMFIIKQNIIVHMVRERLDLLVTYMIMVCDIKALNIWRYMTWTTRYGACGVLWWWVEQRARGHCIFAYSWAGVFFEGEHGSHHFCFIRYK